MNKLTQQKLQELEEKFLKDCEQVKSADALVSEYATFAENHGLSVVICPQNFKDVEVWAQGNASHLCTDANATGTTIGGSPVHIIDEFTVVNTGA